MTFIHLSYSSKNIIYTSVKYVKLIQKIMTELLCFASLYDFTSQFVITIRLIGKLSGNKLGAAGPPFQKTVRSVNENWLKLKSILKQCLDKFIPTKMTSPQENLPWLSKSLLASIQKKASLYSKAKRMNKADLWEKYKLCKRQTQRAIKSARWSFLKNKLSESLEQKNSIPLRLYIKSKRQDGNGVSPLKENDQLHSDSRRKAKILNKQFCSVFTLEDTTNIPKLPGPPNTEMPKFEITVQWCNWITWGFKRRKGIRTGRGPELDSEGCCQRNISHS